MNLRSKVTNWTFYKIFYEILPKDFLKNLYY